MLIILIAFVAFSFIAMSQDRHLRDIGGKKAHFQKPLARWAGGLLLTLSFAITIMLEGWSFGVLLWPVAITVSATFVAIILT
ncbi:MAG: DUF3325 domain-containing protein, partial [Pseudomonadota bacterium]